MPVTTTRRFAGRACWAVWADALTLTGRLTCRAETTIMGRTFVGTRRSGSQTPVHTGVALTAVCDTIAGQAALPGAVVKGHAVQLECAPGVRGWLQALRLGTTYCADTAAPRRAGRALRGAGAHGLRILGPRSGATVDGARVVGVEG